MADIRGMFERYKTARQRLRHPPNAAPDDGIDLKRLPKRAKVIPIIESNVVELPFPVARPMVIYRRYPTLTDILEEVAAFYGVSEIDILSDRRGAECVRARHVMFYLQRVLTLSSTTSIGKFCGKRDHTTAMNGMYRIKTMMATNQRLHDEVTLLQIKISERMKARYLPVPTDDEACHQ